MAKRGYNKTGKGNIDKGINLDISKLSDTEINEIAPLVSKTVKNKYNNAVKAGLFTSPMATLSETPNYDVNINTGKLLLNTRIMTVGEKRQAIKSAQEFMKAPTSSVGGLKKGKEDLINEHDSLSFAKDYTAKQLEYAFRIYSENRDKFGSYHSPEVNVAESIIRLVNDLMSRKPNISYEDLLETITEIIDKQQYDVVEGEILWDIEKKTTKR